MAKFTLADLRQSVVIDVNCPEITTRTRAVGSRWMIIDVVSGEAIRAGTWSAKINHLPQDSPIKVFNQDDVSQRVLQIVRSVVKERLFDHC